MGRFPNGSNPQKFKHKIVHDSSKQAIHDLQLSKRDESTVSQGENIFFLLDKYTPMDHMAMMGTVKGKKDFYTPAKTRSQIRETIKIIREQK